MGHKHSTKIGDQFGRLTVIKTWTGKFGQHKSKELICECKCSCGNMRQLLARYIVGGHTKSCGCIMKERHNKNHPGWKGYEEISSEFWGSIKGGRKRKGRELEFTIDIKHAWKLYKEQHGRCALTGLPISFPKKCLKLEVHPGAPSLDRIDSTKGYIPGNVQWVRKEINQIKWTFSQQQFINWCCLVAANQNIIVSEALARAA